MRRRETTYELFTIAGLGGRNFHSHILLHDRFFGNQMRPPLHMPEDLYSTTHELALVLATLIGQRYGPMALTTAVAHKPSSFLRGKKRHILKA